MEGGRKEIYCNGSMGVNNKFSCPPEHATLVHIYIFGEGV